MELNATAPSADQPFVYVTHIGSVAFLVIGEICLPVDRIKEFDMSAAMTTSTNAVSLIDVDGVRHCWKEAEADAIRAFLSQNRPRVTPGPISRGAEMPSRRDYNQP